MSNLQRMATAGLILAMTSLLFAERPSLPEVRDAEASHILVGKVKAVYERKLATGRQGLGTIEGHYLVEIEVLKVERGKGFAPKDLAYVRCWQITRSGGRITPGASGHGPIPQAGHYVRAYVAKGPYPPTRQEDNGLAAVYPNGFEILDAAALESKATRPVVTYEWPPWKEDLQPDVAGSQPGFDIHAKDPYAKPDDDAGLRHIRMRIAPGRLADGSLQSIRSFHVEFHGGWPPIVDSAFVSPTTCGWRVARSPNGRRLAFSAKNENAVLPEAGLVFVFVVKAQALESATWRSAALLLSSAASLEPPRNRWDPNLVTQLNWTRNETPAGPIDIPLRLPRSR